MRRERLATRVFVLCAAANFSQSLAFNLYLHLPGFLHELGASEVEIGLLGAATALAAIAVRPPLGRALDHGRRRELVVAAGLLNVAVCLLYLTVDALGAWVYAVRVAHGLAEATLFTAFFAMAAEEIPVSRRTEGLALYSASGMLPISIGGLVGDAILARAPYAALFVASAVAAAASLALSLALRPGRRHAARPGGVPPGFARALAQRDLMPLWLLGTVFGLALAGVFTFLKRFAMETGVASVGAFFSAYTGAAIAVRVVGAQLPDRVGPRRVLVPALATLAAGLVLLALAQDARQVLAAGILCGVGHGYTFPVLSSLVVTRAPEHGRGAAIAILTALPDLGALLGAPLLGWVLEVAGFPALFGAAAALIAAGAAGFALWDRPRPASATAG
jgi:MFS family permease